MKAFWILIGVIVFSYGVILGIIFALAYAIPF